MEMWLQRRMKRISWVEKGLTLVFYKLYTKRLIGFCVSQFRLSAKINRYIECMDDCIFSDLQIPPVSALASLARVIGSGWLKLYPCHATYLMYPTRSTSPGREITLVSVDILMPGTDRRVNLHQVWPGRQQRHLGHNSQTAFSPEL